VTGEYYYDLRVDDEIIMPSCWPYLVEPGWAVRMQLWPIGGLSAIPPSESPGLQTSESVSSRVAPSTSSWETVSISETFDYNKRAMASNAFQQSFRRRKGRNRRSWKTRRYSYIARRSVVTNLQKRHYNPHFESDSNHSKLFEQYGIVEDGFETESSGDDSIESGYSVEEPDHPNEAPSMSKKRNFSVVDVTDASQEIIQSPLGGLEISGNRRMPVDDTDFQQPFNHHVHLLKSGLIAERSIETYAESMDALVVFAHDNPQQAMAWPARSSADPESHARDDILASGVQHGVLLRRVTLPSSIFTIDWFGNLQPASFLSASVELVSTNNFWWERYRKFVEIGRSNLTSRIPADQRVDIPNIVVAHTAADVPALSERKLANGAPDIVERPAPLVDKSTGKSIVSQSPPSESGSNGISDSETIPPTLKFRGGGLYDKPKGRPAYVEEVDEHAGRAIRRSRMSASVKSGKGKSIATSEDTTSSRSNSFTDESLSDDTWERVSESSRLSLAPSDSVSILAKARDIAQVGKGHRNDEAGPSNTAATASSGQPQRVRSALSSSTRKKMPNTDRRAHFEADYRRRTTTITSDGSSLESRLDDSGKDSQPFIRPSTSSRRPNKRKPSTDSVEPLGDCSECGREYSKITNQASPFVSGPPSSYYTTPSSYYRSTPTQPYGYNAPSSFSPPPSSFYGQNPQQAAQPGQLGSYAYPPSNSFSPQPISHPDRPGQPNSYAYPPSNLFSSQPTPQTGVASSIFPPSSTPFYGQSTQNFPNTPSTFLPAPFGPISDPDDITTNPTKLYYTPSSRKGKEVAPPEILPLGPESDAAPSQEAQISVEVGESNGQPISKKVMIPQPLSTEKKTIKGSLAGKMEKLASRRGSRPPQGSTSSQPPPPDTPKPKVPEIFRWPVGEGSLVDEEKIPGSPGQQTVSSFHGGMEGSVTKGDLLFTVLKDAHEQLTSYLSRYPNDLEVFNNTEKATQDEVHELVEKFADNRRGSENKKADCELLLETAQQLLQSFTPPTVDEYLVGIFWGSMANIFRSAVSTILLFPGTWRAGLLSFTYNLGLFLFVLI